MNKILTILFVSLCLNLSFANTLNSQNIDKNSTTDLPYIAVLYSQLDKESLKELEIYDKNIYNLPKTKQEQIELNALIDAIMNGDYNKIKEILDKNPNLINLNADIFTTPISAYFSSIAKFKNSDLETKFIFQNQEIVQNRKEIIQNITKNRDFDKKIFELLLSYKPKLYTNDLTPFIVIRNENINDEETALIIQMMIDEGMNVEIKYPPIGLFNITHYLITDPDDLNKFKTLELLFKNLKDKKFIKTVAISSGFWDNFGFIGDLDIKLKNPISEKQKKYAASKEYKELRNKRLEIIKLVKKYGGDEALSSLVSWEILFKYIDDEIGLNALKSIGYKERRKKERLWEEL